MKHLYWFPVFIFFTICLSTISCFAEGIVLVITNLNATVHLDGTAIGEAQANKPYKIITGAGEHYVQVEALLNGKALEASQVIMVEEGKQRVIKLQLENPTTPAPTPASSSFVEVAQLNFALAGVFTVSGWTNNNPGKNYPYPTHYFAFEKGDEIVLDVSMTNKKGTNQLEVATYPAGVVKYTNKTFTELKELTFKVDERSIYRFTFATNHSFDRNCIVKVRRRPASAQTARFNTNVVKKTIYKPVSIVEPQTHFVNSGSNATWKGGKSRVVVPISLPANTVEWFYRLSASRNESDIKQVQKNFKLATELTSLALKASGAGLVAGKSAGIAIGQLSTPPGTDYCDIFLLDNDNIASFEAKQDEICKYKRQGTNKNIKAGNVKIDCCLQGQYYLGLRNPDTYYGIIISLEAIAITVAEEYVMEQI